MRKRFMEFINDMPVDVLIGLFLGACVALGLLLRSCMGAL